MLFTPQITRMETTQKARINSPGIRTTASQIMRMDFLDFQTMGITFCIHNQYDYQPKAIWHGYTLMRGFDFQLKTELLQYGVKVSQSL